MRVRGSSYFHGRYQLTVPGNATEKDIAAYLPDTLPVRVWVENMHCDLDCPVIWKPITLSGLTPGESIVIENAAEPVIIPVGTLLDTPLGIFQLEKPLTLGEIPWSANELQLILNVVSPGESPSGALAVDREMLKMSFTKKPTGATSIQAYTLSEGETTWTEIPGLSLLDAVNIQPSKENSGYATIFDKDTEPFRSYLEASAAGFTPVPFFVGLKIKGGVYDGQQLILPWPGSYENLPNLPSIDGGSGGNENNAGSGSKNDSTEGGQRPNLPQQPEDTTNQPGGGNTQTPGNTQSPENNESTQNPDGTQLPEDNESIQNPGDIKPLGNMEGQPEPDKNTQIPGSTQQLPQNSENQPGYNTKTLSDSIPQPEAPQEPEIPQEPEFSKQLKSQQQPELLQQPELPQQPELLQQAGLSQQANDTVNRPISIPAIAGAIGIAGIGTAIWGRKALARLFGKIRSILHDINLI